MSKIYLNIFIPNNLLGKLQHLTCQHDFINKWEIWPKWATLQAWQASLPVPPPSITQCEQNERYLGRCQILLCWNSPFAFSDFMKLKDMHCPIIFNHWLVTVVTKPTCGVFLPWQQARTSLYFHLYLADKISVSGHSMVWAPLSPILINSSAIIIKGWLRVSCVCHSEFIKLNELNMLGATGCSSSRPVINI